MKNTGRLWLENLFLAVLLGMLSWLWWTTPEQRAVAAGGGWETNGIMAAVSNPAQRLIIVNTNPNVQSICVYRNTGLGTFRLVGARSYKYDVEMIDTSRSTWSNKGAGRTYSQIRLEYEAYLRNSKNK